MTRVLGNTKGRRCLMDSILTSIKKMLGMAEEYTEFDVDIIININSVFSTLRQLGVGPLEGFVIEDDDASWSDFTSDESKWQMVKTYVYLKTRLAFDPPTNGTVIESINKQINELEWRLYTEAEITDKQGGV